MCRLSMAWQIFRRVWPGHAAARAAVSAATISAAAAVAACSISSGGGGNRGKQHLRWACSHRQRLCQQRLAQKRHSSPLRCRLSIRRGTSSGKAVQIRALTTHSFGSQLHSWFCHQRQSACNDCYPHSIASPAVPDSILGFLAAWCQISPSAEVCTLCSVTFPRSQ